MRPRPSFTGRTGIVVAALVVGLITAWLIRPLLHGPVMFLWTAPLVWLPPVIVLAAGLALGGRRRLTVADLQAGRWPGGGLIASAIVAFVVFIVAAALNGPLTERAIFQATNYEQVDALPAGGEVRLLPKEVAEQVASGGFNSPTESLTDFHIVRTPEGLKWTALRTPDGAVRTFTKKSRGIITLDAQQTARDFDEIDAEFKYAPGLQVTDNLRWQLLKRHFLITLGEATGILDRNGRPLIAVPYTEYRGILVRRPAFGGVFVVSPSGRIEDLEPAEARRRPELAASARLFPETLARRVQDAYAYKRGIWNKFFIHEEQTQITDTEANRQPYLIDFGPGRGSKWVTVAEPYGRAFAANAVFLTDTVTGDTQVWRVPRGQSLTGNRRALQTVRSLTIPGVVFADSDRPSIGGGGGRFRAVEPRPVFVGRRLVYLVSIVPESANSVSKTVIIDAASNKQVALFDNDSDPQAEEKTLEYLKTGVVPGEDGGGGADPTPNAGQDQTPAGGSGSGSNNNGRTGGSVEGQIDDLIERQRDLLSDFERLRRQLRERETAGGAQAP